MIKIPTLGIYVTFKFPWVAPLPPSGLTLIGVLQLVGNPTKIVVTCVALWQIEISPKITRNRYHYLTKNWTLSYWACLGWSQRGRRGRQNRRSHLWTENKNKQRQSLAKAGDGGPFSIMLVKLAFHAQNNAILENALFYFKPKVQTQAYHEQNFRLWVASFEKMAWHWPTPPSLSKPGATCFERFLKVNRWHASSRLFQSVQMLAVHSYSYRIEILLLNTKANYHNGFEF